MGILKNIYSRNPCVAILITVWIFTLIILGTLQLIGASFGFKVWALGEDRVWLNLIQSFPNKTMAQGWWAHNDRNPLSAWWWLAISPLVRHSDWALYIVRKCLDPILAICTFLLLDQLGRKNCRAFAFSVALIVLLWNFSTYHESVLWDMLGALSLTLLTLFFYCRYIDSARHNANDLALALLCYLIAISTYTIQSGAIIGVAALAFFRNAQAPPLSISTRVKNTIRDTMYFIAIFIVYNCIWYTVNRNNNVYFMFQFSLFLKQISQSIHQLLFHTYYLTFLNRTWKDWSMFAILITWLCAFSAMCLILFRWFPKKLGSAFFSSNIPIGWVIVVLLSIATPTLILESTSNIWTPGTRSLMVQQVWQPLLYVSSIFILSNILFPKFRNIIAFIGVAFLGATVYLVGLDYNYRLVLRTAYQRNLVDEIKKLNIATSTKPAFLVKFTNPTDVDLNALSPLIRTFSQTVFRKAGPTIRTLVSFDPGIYPKDWKPILGVNKDGATNVRILCDETITPYSNLWIIFFDGKKISIPEKIDKNDFEGLQLVWNRKEPLDQRKNHPEFFISNKVDNLVNQTNIIE